MSKKYICYALEHSSSRKVYTGMTNNFTRRLRQHNGELKGGARSTHCRRGHWAARIHVEGFESKGEAMSFEHAWKKTIKGGGLRGRIRSLEHLCLTTPFAIRVRCFMTRERYLSLSRLTADEFDEMRSACNIYFLFQNL